MVYKPINVLISSMLTSFILSVVLTPIDLLCYQNLTSGRPISSIFSQLRATQGLGMLSALTTSSTFIRYLFVFTLYNMTINHQRTKLLTE